MEQANKAGRSRQTDSVQLNKGEIGEKHSVISARKVVCGVRASLVPRRCGIA